MEHKVKIVPPEAVMADLPELLEDGHQIPLVISGNSMSPFLIHGRDTVYLRGVYRPLKRGDMILYRRENGAYVLHRICRVGAGCFDLVGDAQTQVEQKVRRDQVLAVVSAVRRKGKLLKPGDPCWDFFEKVWIRIIPIRWTAMAGYSRLRGWIRR